MCALLDTVRSSRPELFYKKSVQKNFAKFTGKNSFCLLKKKLWHTCFPKYFPKFLKIIEMNSLKNVQTCSYYSILCL